MDRLELKRRADAKDEQAYLQAIANDAKRAINQFQPGSQVIQWCIDQAKRNLGVIDPESEPEEYAAEKARLARFEGELAKAVGRPDSAEVEVGELVGATQPPLPASAQISQPAGVRALPERPLPLDEVKQEKKRAYEKYRQRCIDEGERLSHHRVAINAKTSWNDRTPVTKWLANDPRYSKPENDAAIRRVFEMRPKDLKP